MSESSTTTATVSRPTSLEQVAMYRDASPAIRRLLHLDKAAVLADGLSEQEYLECLAEWGGTAEEYLAESWLLVDGELAQRDCGAVDVEAARATFAGLAEQQGEEQGELEPGKVAAQVGDAKARAEEAEAAAREVCQETLKALVTAYRKGEREYRVGLLEAGRLCQEYITSRVALGDKRKAAVQTVEGQLAMYASDSVDANRLVRCWEAYRLLCQEPGLVKEAAKVAYGVYRDAWSQLVERLDGGTDKERWVLLVGMEAECKDAFRKATVDSLSKAACHDQCQALLRAKLAKDAAAKQAAEEAAKAAKAEAEKRAAVALAETQEAARLARLAEEAQEQAAGDAKDAAEEAAQEQDPVAKAEAEKAAAEAAEAARLAEEEAKRAKAVAAEKAAAEQRERFAAEQKAREEARAKEEARLATQRQCEAEAKKAEQDRKAAQREADKAAGIKPGTAKQPSAEAKQGQNLLATARAATSKDLVAMVYDMVSACQEPDTVVEGLLRGLAGCKELSKPTIRAIQAAVLLLDRAPAQGMNGHGSTPANGATIKQPA